MPNTSLCDVNEQFPVGTRVVKHSTWRPGGGTLHGEVVSATEKNDRTITDRVGAAFKTEHNGGVVFVTVRWDHTGDVGSASPANLVYEPKSEKTYTQAEMDEAVQNAKAMAYTEGKREGAKRAAQRMEMLAADLRNHRP